MTTNRKGKTNRNTKKKKEPVKRVRNGCKWCGYPLHRLACTCQVCLQWDCPDEDHTRHPDSPRCPQGTLWGNNGIQVAS